MNVETILKRKGNAVQTNDCRITLGEAAKILKAKRIGALVLVDDQGKLAGIISERDIVCCMAECGGEAAERSVCDFMTRDVATARLSDSLDRIMEIMTEGRFRHLPVVEDGELVGIISIGDVVKQRIDDIAFEAEQMKRYIAS